MNKLTQDLKEKLTPFQTNRLICNLLQDESNNKILSAIKREVIVKPVVSVEDIINIKIKHNLSNNTTEGLAADLQIAASGRKLLNQVLKKL